MTWCERAATIQAIILDVDGVLTDGRIGYGPDGSRVVSFNVRDGLAIRMALRTGLLVGFLTGRGDPATLARAKELGLSFVYAGDTDKAGAFERLLREQSLAPEQCLYVGDDLPDLPVMRAAGIGAAVADAAPELHEAADWVLESPGGHGAVRELIECLLRERGLWQQVSAHWL